MNLGIGRIPSKVALSVIFFYTCTPICAQAIEAFGMGPFGRPGGQGVTCKRLSPGESATIEFGSLSPTPVRHAYRLFRTGAASYRTQVNLVLMEAPGEHIERERLVSFQTKIKKCLREQSPWLKGPDGESLEIEIFADQNVPISKVFVTSANVRADAGLYPLNMTCPMILHEILHLHGLVDEYREQVIGFKTDPTTGEVKYIREVGDTHAFNCRALGPENSIMRNEWESVLESHDFAIWSYATCTKEMSDGWFPEISCPTGAHPAWRIVNLDPEDEFQVLNGDVVAAGSKPEKIGMKNKTRTSILEPAQFLAITRPGCYRENALYYICSANAYLSRENPANCPTLPRECSDPRAWLSGKEWFPQVTTGTGGFGDGRATH